MASPENNREVEKEADEGRDLVITSLPESLEAWTNSLPLLCQQYKLTTMYQQEEEEEVPGLDGGINNRSIDNRVKSLKELIRS